MSEQFLNSTLALIRLFSALRYSESVATIKVNNKDIVKSKRENNVNKNMNTNDKSVRL